MVSFYISYLQNFQEKANLLRTIYAGHYGDFVNSRDILMLIQVKSCFMKFKKELLGVIVP